MKGLVVAMILSGGLASAAVADTKEAMGFACVASSAKAGDVGGLCALFEHRLSQMFPDKAPRAVPEAEAEVTLRVEASGPQSMVAQLVWRDGRETESLGMAQRGAPLNDAQRAEFLDDLLRKSAR